MAISAPVLLGTGASAGTSATTITVTTTVAVPVGGLIVVGTGGWSSSGAGAITCSGGGLTWNLDKYANTGNFNMAQFSAQAPSGLAAGTIITCTFATAHDGRPIGAFYVTGASIPEVTSSAAPGAGTAGSAGTMTTSTVGDMVTGLLFADVPVTSSTPGANYTEVWDVPTPADSQTLTLEYRLDAPVGANNPVNTWANSVGTNLGIGVAYKSASGTSIPKRMPLGV